MRPGSRSISAVCFFLHFGHRRLWRLVARSSCSWAWPSGTSVPPASTPRRALEASAASYGAQEAAGRLCRCRPRAGDDRRLCRAIRGWRGTRPICPQMEAAHANGRIGGMIRFLRLFLQSAALGLGAWLAINKQISGGAIFAASMLASRALSSDRPDRCALAHRVPGASALMARSAAQLSADEGRLSQNSAAHAGPTPAGEPGCTVADPGPGPDHAAVGSASPPKGGQVVGVIGVERRGQDHLDAGPGECAGRLTRATFASMGRGIPTGTAKAPGPVSWAMCPRTAPCSPARLRTTFPGLISPPAWTQPKSTRWPWPPPKRPGVHELILVSTRWLRRQNAGTARGKGLSSGQQQRIALARAMYGDPVRLHLRRAQFQPRR